jgi:hypothetical protein
MGGVVSKSGSQLHQTTCVVATDGVGPFALRRGRADLFARSAVLEYLAGTPVGELIVGSTRG